MLLNVFYGMTVGRRRERGEEAGSRRRDEDGREKGRNENVPSSSVLGFASSSSSSSSS